MNPQRSNVRKIVYLVAIVVLLLLLIVIGQPATSDIGETPGSPGGLLAQLRSKHGFSESDLGEVDPASETLKLATLGMRGIAANILWEKANAYKMKKDWSNLSATLTQIAKLEPHFVKVWRFQAWNLSYNVSAEFDDYRERYRWVIKGIDYLNQGTRHNRKDAMLVWDIGWFVSQKLGRADEWKQFRRLFKQDDEFFRRYNDPRPEDLRDNWLVGKDWFALSEYMVDNGADLSKSTPALFYSHRPMSQQNYSDALEKDGVFDEKAFLAWKQAEDEWYQYGDRSLPTYEPGVTIRMNDKERFLDEAKKRVAELEKLEPGLRQKVLQERLAKLTPLERQAFDTPREKRTTRELFEAGMKADLETVITHEQVARKISNSALFGKALDLAKQAMEFEAKAAEIDIYRVIVNYEYWRLHAQVEQQSVTREAHKAIYLGDQAMAKGDLDTAKKRYDEGLKLWRTVLDNKAWPALKEEGSLGRDLIEITKRYRRILERRDEPFPEKYVLQDILEIHKNLIED